MIIPLAAATILLVGCSSNGNDTLAQTCTVDRTTVDQFSLCLPSGWTVASESFGEGESVVFHLASPDFENKIMQIHVKKDPLEQPVHSMMAFAERAAEISRDTAPNYEPVRTQPITVNRQDSLLHVFDASPKPEADPVRYYQFVTVHSDIAYGFTGVMFTGGNADLEETLVNVFTNVLFD